MTDERIVEGLKSQFERHRLVFWYDTKHEFKDDFNSLDITGIKKLEINNNEFNIKYQVIHEEPDQKFLIYKEGASPENPIDNWLLDLELAYTNFRTDKVQLWLDELQLNSNLADTIREHETFFSSSARRNRLKEIITPEDDSLNLKFKMLFVISNSQQEIEGVVATLFSELSKEEDNTLKLFKRCNLDQFLWDSLKRLYDYKPETPTIEDFAIELFKSSFQMACNKPSQLNTESQLLFRRWKNDRNNSNSFEDLSSQYQKDLGIKEELDDIDLDSIIEVDYFEEIERYFIQSLLRDIQNQTIQRKEVKNKINRRRNSHFFNQFESVYNTLFFASELFHEMSGMNFGMESFNDGLMRYTKTWFKIDQHYRKFIFNFQRSSQPTLLNDLYEFVENKYSNDFLLKVNDVWQSKIDPIKSWKSDEITSQMKFYDHFVGEYRRKETKLAVIISDAMRYEVGDELLSIIRERDRFDAELHPVLASVPSYTQLGMASLLPNQNLKIHDVNNGTISIDGRLTSGIDNRKSILESNDNSISTTAKHAKDIINLRTTDVKDLVRNNDLIYIYHNVIDAAGDTTNSEDTVFKAVSDAIKELNNLVKKLTSGNINHILITSDHGFIYQNRKLDDSEYLGEAAQGDEINYTDRRFVIGKGLIETHNFKKFKAEEIGLEGDEEFLFPKSINRLRKSGAGSQYVHGGLSLQEIVLPVLKINKGRESDTNPVEISILVGASRTITTSQLSIKLYQDTEVSEKIHARTLQLGIFNKDGNIISDTRTLIFDNDSSNPRDRETHVRLLLRKSADKFNNEDVFLKLEERVSNTSTFKLYKQEKYLLKRSFTNDFDF